jgi:4-oxalocrotonate tautomerase
MPFIYVEVIEGAFTPAQKRHIVERLTDALLSVTGERLRAVTSCVIEEAEWSTAGIHASLAAAAGTPAAEAG